MVLFSGKNVYPYGFNNNGPIINQRILFCCVNWHRSGHTKIVHKLCTLLSYKISINYKGSELEKIAIFTYIFRSTYIYEFLFEIIFIHTANKQKNPHYNNLALFWKSYHPIHLYLIFEKDQAGRTWFLVYFKLDFCRLHRQ